eukprot:scaffold3165_cov62-Cyclotella_meneghiniana.AAC.12
MGPANDNCCHCGGGSEIPPTVSPTISGAPSKSSSAPTRICYDTYNWTDAAGDGCDFYEKYDDPGCPDTGSFGGTMGAANDNCCYCGGGSENPHPTVSPTISGAPSSSSPTVSPTLSGAPSIAPTSAPTTCQDTPGWHDRYGYDCLWYEVMDDPGCPKYGDGNHKNYDGYYDYYYFDHEMGVAKDNCCHCKNTIAHVVPSTEDSSLSSTCVDTPGWMDAHGYGCDWYEEVDLLAWAPTLSGAPLIAPTSAPTTCQDTPGWYDVNGHDCPWYEVMDDPGCPKYGDILGTVVHTIIASQINPF